MTNDEAKSVLFNMLGKGIFVEDTKENQAILVALRAMEQEQCDDAISRQEITEYLQRIVAATDTNSQYNKGFVDGIGFCITNISTMPPVTPHQKTGHWIVHP